MIPSGIDLILVAGLWWYLASESGVTLTLVSRSTPDLVLAAGVATIVATVWAAFRCARVTRALSGKRTAMA